MESNLEIKTDHKWKSFKYGNEVDNRNDYKDYDWMDEDDKFDGWIIYRKRLYHLCDFMTAKGFDDFADWDGYLSDSFFSGVLIKVSDDGERYKIGTYCS